MRAQPLWMKKNLETSIDRTVYKPTCPTKYTIQVKSQTCSRQSGHAYPARLTTHDCVRVTNNCWTAICLARVGNSNSKHLINQSTYHLLPSPFSASQLKYTTTNSSVVFSFNFPPGLHDEGQCTGCYRPDFTARMKNSVTETVLLTFRGEAQFPTHHSSIISAPGIITNCAPLIVHADLHSAFIRNVTSGKSQTSCAWGCGNDIRPSSSQ